MSFSNISKPALQLIPKLLKEDSTLISKFGGKPAIKSLEEWPKAKGGELMSFVGQINFEEIAGKHPEIAKQLPAKGILMFFLDEEGMFDGSGFSKFIYVENPVEGAEFELPEQSLEVKIAALETKQIESYPRYLDEEQLEKAGIKAAEFTDEKRYAYEDKYTKQNHQLLGFAFPVQDDPVFDLLDTLGELPEFPEYEGGLAGKEKELASKKREEIRLERVRITKEKAKEWVMLWQIISDDEIFSTLFGDDGLFYALIEKEKLQKSDFSNIQLVLQG
ncbi:MAG: DUF1963 domain-containing protein [Candidatus Altimarinota bacterium]